MKPITEKEQKKKHWLLGDQSYLEHKNINYRVGTEPAHQKKKGLLNSLIRFPIPFKWLIPRYWLAITRRRGIDVYDPLVTVYPDQVSFIMRDASQWIQGFWQLVLYEKMFKQANFEPGHIFIDFNRNFISQVRSLKKDDQAHLIIDKTGLTYQTNEFARFLPHEDRPTLIELLQQKEREFNATPDQELELPTAQIWNQAITRNERYAVSPLKEDFPSLFDTHGTKGEVYNPFYCYTGTTSLFENSKIAKMFHPTSVLKFFEDSNEYQLKTPLIQKYAKAGFCYIGHIQCIIEGRKAPGYFRDN